MNLHNLTMTRLRQLGKCDIHRGTNGREYMDVGAVDYILTRRDIVNRLHFLSRPKKKKRK